MGSTRPPWREQTGQPRLMQMIADVRPLLMLAR
jgi:hypothetical protein